MNINGETSLMYSRHNNIIDGYKTIHGFKNSFPQQPVRSLGSVRIILSNLFSHGLLRTAASANSSAASNMPRFLTTRVHHQKPYRLNIKMPISKAHVM